MSKIFSLLVFFYCFSTTHSAPREKNCAITLRKVSLLARAKSWTIDFKNQLMRRPKPQPGIENSEYDLSDPLVRLSLEILRDGRWFNENLLLLTPKQFEQLPDGTILRSILDKVQVKGTDYISEDTRGGAMSVGIRKRTLADFLEKNKKEALDLEKSEVPSLPAPKE